jgi:hypothetical protein
LLLSTLLGAGVLATPLELNTQALAAPKVNQYRSMEDW